MKVPLWLTAYRELLVTNGVMLALLSVPLGLCLLVQSMAAALLFLLLSLGCCFVELVLFLRALVTGHFRLALGYGFLLLAAATFEWNLLEAFE
jgi:hypothetical protein